MRVSVDTIVADLADNQLHDYWPGFQAVAYALYDKEVVYLFNHPAMIKEPGKNYQMIKWDDHFIGCTLILYQKYPTAIVDLALYEDYASLYSILVHELFHGLQYHKGESRFANEVMGVTYPLLKENVELRNRERSYLYDAVVERDRPKKRQLLASFIALREKRAAIIDEYIEYEHFIETIEGPALYVELKSYHEKSERAFSVIVQEYGQQLTDAFDSTSYIRRSCYHSGLFICLLLDEFVPDWKGHFWNKEETIYGLLKQFSDKVVQINEIKISCETEEVIENAVNNREKEIQSIERQEGFHLVIEGNIMAKSFDPMNIVLFENKLLHKQFLKIEINNQDYLIEQPVITYFKRNIQHITKLHLVVKERPTKNIASLTIDRIGEIKGMYEQQDEALHLYVN